MRRAIKLYALSLLLFGCQQKDLCTDHWNHTSKCETHILAEWDLTWEYQYENGPNWQNNWSISKFGFLYEELNPTKPEGLRTIIYNENGNQTEQNLSADGGKLYITKGTYQVLCYNNDFEYVTLNNGSAAAEVSATTRSRTRADFNGISMVGDSRNESTANAPDPFFGYYIDQLQTQESMASQHFHLIMRPLVFTYLIRYHVASGLEYIGLSRGAMSGMAQMVYLADSHTSDDKVTILYDCERTDWGIEARVNSFGVPNYPHIDYPRCNGHHYGLNLETLLKNGKKLSFDFDITEQMQNQPRGGVIEVFDIVIPDSIGEENSGMFEVEVESWKDEIDIPIIF